MDALGIVYLQYWVLGTTDDTFHNTWRSLKHSMGMPRNPTKGTMYMHSVMFVFFLQDELEVQLHVSKDKLGNLNPVTVIWHKLSTNVLLASKMLAEMALVKFMGSGEDEKVFSAWSFMRTKLMRNKLTDLFDLKVCMFCQTIGSLTIYLLTTPFVAWKQCEGQVRHACMRQFPRPTCYDWVCQLFDRLEFL